ncbi:3'-5' exonuclease-like [Mercurialis annua]|uniref:3'-5' exonuclease-like n=1 Tax=Mercurialis annua TaxID=3986 RepID=UPI00216042B2|nr:3'-5' exonuclease-like [Mercurialis annua]
MTITITDYGLINDTHNLFDITFFTDQIHTLLTHSPAHVNQWLTQTRQQANPNQPTVVGLDVEWRPSFSRNIENPVATLQLCVGNRCLIYQLIHTPSIPQSLFDFLKDSNFMFVGVGIANDVEKLVYDYELSVGRAMDLGSVAADVMGVRELKNAGLKELVRRVLGREIEKPKRVTMSRWDSMWLSLDQVQYACVDAFVCSEIGRRLIQG